MNLHETVNIGSRRELFVDHFLIDTLDDCRLKLHHPQDEGVALAFEKPWEGMFCAYAPASRDEVSWTL